MAAKEIKAILSLKDKKFNKGIGNTQKNVMKFTGAIVAVGAAVAAATVATAHFLDETIKASRAAGSTAEDFSALRYAADLSGISMENLSKGLRKITEPSTMAQKEFDRLGISITTVSGSAKTQNEILNDLADSYGDMVSPADKAASAVRIFGDKGAEMVNMIGGGSEKLKSMTDEAKKLGLVFSEKAGEAAEKFNDSTTKLIGSIKGLVQQTTGAIIEFMNEAGVMETLSGAIQSVTGWWMSLDDSTKKIIITIGGAIVGISALILVIMAFTALAPAVGAAITVMTGGLNLIVLAVVAAIAAFAAIAYGAIKYWDQVKQAIQPAIEAVQMLVAEIKNALQPIGAAFAQIGADVKEALGSVIKNFKEFAGISDDSTKNLSVLGTIAKVIFAGISTIILIAIMPFKLLYTIISGIVDAIIGLGSAMKNVLSGDFKKAGEAAAGAMKRIKTMGIDIKDQFVATGQKIKNSFKNIGVTMDTKKAQKSIKKIKNSITGLKDAAKKGGGDAGNELVSSLQEATGKISSWAGQIGSIVGGVSDLMTNSMSQALDAMSDKFDIYSNTYSKSQEKQIEAVSKAEDEKIAMMSSRYDEELSALKMHEENKLGIIQNGASERVLALDEEYQAAQEKQEEEFERWMEQEEIRYEAEKELLLVKAIDKEQRLLVESLMDQDYKGYVQNQEFLHKQKMEKLTSDHIAKTKTSEDLYTTEKIATETKTKKLLETMTEEKNKNLEKAEEEKNAKLKQLEEKKLADEKLLKKLSLLMNWKAEKSQFEQTKGMQIASTILQGIAGAAGAFAMAVGSIPLPFGAILGGIMAALVLTMSAASAAQIGMQTIPPPASLYMAGGGYLSGPSHSAGGISANLEGGEGIIDKYRTQKLIESVDSTTGGKSVNIIFKAGAIQNSGEAMDESFIDKISYALSRRLERDGVFA